MSESIVFRQGKRVYLRPFHKSEAPLLQRWMNDPEVTQYLLRTFPVTESEEDEWLANQGKGKNDFAFAIVTIEGSKMIGTIGLHGINWIDRTGTTGTVIGDKAYWGKGYGTEAKMLLLDFAFNGLDLYGVMSRVMVHNKRSLAYGNKCGYEEIGRLPKWIHRKNGQRCDEVLLVVTQKKWRPLWRKYLKQQKSSEK